MPRYFFNLHECGTFIADEEGREFPDIHVALERATAEARALLASEVEQGRLCLDCHIEVVEADTGEAFSVPFRPLVTITDSAAGSQFDRQAYSPPAKRAI